MEIFWKVLLRIIKLVYHCSNWNGHFIWLGLHERENLDLYVIHKTPLAKYSNVGRCCVSYFDYESNKQDCLCHKAGHKAHHARSVSRIRRKAQRDRAGSQLRHPVCRGTKSMHLARSIGPILESCLLLTQATLSLSSSLRLFLSFFFFSFYWDLPRKTLFDRG